MKNIVNEIREVDKEGGNKKKGVNFARETTLSWEYLKGEILKKYPNLEFIRIYMKKVTVTPSYHETFRDVDYYMLNAFIDKNILDYISKDYLISKYDDDKIIDLTKNWWEEQLKLRNKILSGCPIILAVTNCSLDIDRSYKFNNSSSLSMNKNIVMYPCSYQIEGYELLNSTRFVLISNSCFIAQKELDDFCLDLLEHISLENEKVIGEQKAIYLSISRKLKNRKRLNHEEMEVVQQFIDVQVNEIEKENTLLVRSRALVKRVEV